MNINHKWRPQKRLQEILENFNLFQHINLLIRKGTKIIDHIITKIPNKKYCILTYYCVHQSAIMMHRT